MERPHIVAKWFQHVRKNPKLLKGRWIASVDPDTLFINPLMKRNASNALDKGYAASFHFLKLSEENEAALKPIFPGLNLSQLPSYFPGFAVLSFEDWEKINEHSPVVHYTFDAQINHANGSTVWNAIYGT